MKKYYYDLHTHSCLSPCADNDNTPNNLAGMASISGINILALTDHNTTKNCPAFFKACERLGVVPIAGMELTSSEDIHIVCLFEHLDDAKRFDDAVNSWRTLVKNRPDIFGEQLILDENDEIIGKEEYLLSNATALSVEDIPELIKRYGGVAYPAHIDRDANGIIAVLGTFPEDSDFTAFELRDGENLSKYSELYGLSDKLPIISSDAHYLEGIRDAENYFELSGDDLTDDEVRRQLFEILKKPSVT